MSDYSEVLKKVRDMFPHIEELWVTYTTNQYHAVSKYPNGHYYIDYNVLDGEGSSVEGPFKNLEKCKEEMEKYPHYTSRVWENPDVPSVAGTLNLLYTAKFFLTNEVNDLYEAQDYLTEDDMTKYLKDDLRLSRSTREKVETIRWNLFNVSKGQIEVRTNDYLTESESREISDWISGQNSDGLGEGFEQQDFACYSSDYDNHWYDDDYEYECDNDIMARFDWETNDYELVLQE